MNEVADVVAAVTSLLLHLSARSNCGGQSASLRCGLRLREQAPNARR
jgi:hypothetical protein